jgi:hypothetical protein
MALSDTRNYVLAVENDQEGAATIAKTTAESKSFKLSRDVSMD